MTVLPAHDTGDTELYIFTGMVAAVVISLRVFLFKGAGELTGSDVNSNRSI